MKTETEDKLVVDASVMAAVFFREPEAALAERRLSKCKWIAPVLLDYEMGSVFLKKTKLYPRLRTQLEQCYQIFCASSIERIEIPVLSVVPIAEQYGLTIYDASYFWLAEELNVDLFTFDKVLSTVWMKK